MQDYLSVKEMADKWAISPRRLQILCKAGRVEGAVVVGNMWLIPPDVQKPLDARVKSGKYSKSK